MKIKKITLLITALTAAMLLTACSPLEMLQWNADEEEEEDSSRSSRSKKNDDEEDTEKKKAASGIMFGDEFDEDDLDLTYLYMETLMSESKENPKTGKMESQKLQILIPRGDYNSVNRDYAYSDKLGVEVRVDINSYMLPYNYEDYTLKENLDRILQRQYDEFDYTNYWELQITEAKGDEEQVQATVSYLYYNVYSDDYTPYQATYQLCDFGNGMIAMVTTTICASDTTSKTQLILDEINAFYGADIEWDGDAAEKRLQKFLANHDDSVVPAATGWMLFELPKGWQEDWKNNNDFTCTMYAPDGDMFSQGCYITVGREYQSYGSDLDIAYLLENEKDMELFKKAIAELSGIPESDITVRDYGTTVLGQALEMSYSVSEEGLTFVEHRWWITDKDYVYEITAGQLKDGKTDVIAIAEQILAKGRVKGTGV